MIERVHTALSRVMDPCSLASGPGMSLVDMGLVISVTAERGDVVHVVLGMTGPGCTFVGMLVAAAETECRAELGAEAELRVTVDPSFVWHEGVMSDAARQALAQRRRATVAALGLRPRQWQEHAA